MKRHPQYPRLNERITFVALLIAAALLTETAAAGAAHRVYLSKESDTPAAAISGRTEMIVTPPEIPASVTLFVDGAPIGTKTAAPYTFDVDFGPQPLERKISVSARSGSKSIRWSRIFNRGRQPLTITLEATDDGVFRAETTAPEDDPVVEVSFFAGATLLATLTEPPWVLHDPPADTSTIFVTAKSRSGAEVADTFAMGDVLVAAYDVRTVPLFVSVIDDRGIVLDGLSRSDFKVFDKGKAAKIIDFGRAWDEPISLALVVDASSSMGQSMSAVAGAARRFLDSVIRDGDRVALFTIRSVPKREVALSSDTSQFRSAIDGMRAGGETALYDSVSTAIRELRDEQRRRAIVLLSDGDDTSSNRTFEEIALEAKQAGIPIFSIVFDAGVERASRARDELQFLAVSTGGFIASARTDDLAKRYDLIAKDLRSQYAIRYQVADASKPQEWRPVKVVLNSPKLSARTISGYFAP